METPIFTHQREANDPPTHADRYLCLAIACTTCGTLRVFRTEAALGRLMSRKTQHIAVSTSCEHCQTGIAVTLFWGKVAHGFSYRELALSTNVSGVSDVFGLQRQQ